MRAYSNHPNRGKSNVQSEIEKPHGVSGHWKALPHVAQIAIVASAIGVAIILLALLLFCCIKQRRAGRREHAALEQQYKKEAAERAEARRAMFLNGQP
jgi:flagellar biosynthesis/type III secretory pathway M-ring protein FliF/YscJ